MLPEIPERILISIILISLLGIAMILWHDNIDMRDSNFKTNYAEFRTHSIQNVPLTQSVDPFDSLSKEQKLKQIHQKCAINSIQLQSHGDIINEFALSVHSKNTKFLNKAVGLQHDGEKGYGLVANRDIIVGELLFVEYPLLKINAKSSADSSLSMMLQINKQVKSQYITDCEFAKIWDVMDMNPMDAIWIKESLKSYGPQPPISVNNMAKVFTNQINGKWNVNQEITVYGLLSKINFGLPQNVAMIVGGKKYRDVGIVIATKDIVAGTELVRDYLLDWFGYKGMDMNGDEFKEKMHIRNIQSSIFTQGKSRMTNGIKMDLLKKLNSEKYSEAEKYEMAVRELYPNGIVGKTTDAEAVEFLKGGGRDKSEIVDKIIEEIALILMYYKSND